MEREDNVQLIHAILSGDDSAFGILVEKYKNSIHALAWEKTGDFHYAEDITQDTFLRAYQKLSTLKDPNLFPNWLYQIATNCCRNWLRKHKPVKQLQSLEDTPVAEVAQSDYDIYVMEQRETEATERRFEIVKKLLEKLPEGQRLVVTLHFLDEMKHAEIGEFLGISEEAVRTRLHRARRRLQEEEELLVQEALGGVQISSSIKQNIMRQIADMNPTSPPIIKPFLPWVTIGTALVVATLFFFSVSNLGNRYLAHFQKLYSNYFADDADGTKSAKDFTADFSITLGTHRSGVSLLVALLERECDVSPWSRQALGNPSFPVVAAETTVDIVVVSMLELGFAADELATLDAIYARAKQIGLEACPVETAPQLRLQFLDQPNWSTGARLGSFFVASEPFVLTHEGFPKIFSVLRDDDFPHPETGIGLWLISNGTLDSETDGHPDRLFNASDSDDHDGRFAFVIPK